MYLGNDLIDSVPVNLYELSKPGYLGRFKRQLKQRYAELLLQSDVQPEFLVVNLTPAVNTQAAQNINPSYNRFQQPDPVRA